MYLLGYESVPELEQGLEVYVRFYTTEQPHQSLDYRTPAEVRSGHSREDPRSR